MAPAASAGTLRVADETHQLAPSQLQAVSSVVAGAPFDGRLVVTTDYADAQDLARYVHTLVTSPSLVVVGLDPVHRHVQVRFGVESGVPRAQWADVERAGNDAFRRGDWAGGASAIFETAARSAAASPLANPDEPSPSRQLAPVEPQRPSMFGSTFLVLAVLGVVVAGLYFVARRRDGRGGYGPPGGYGPGPGYGPGGGYYGGGYGPPAGGMGPVGGGLLGAGLGGLAGYELGKAAGEREERDRDDRDDLGNSGGGGNDDYDAGGGGSGWDDSGGSDGGGSDGGGSDF